jgi:hypothetical protein
MKILWSHALIPVAGALIAAPFISVGFWDLSKQPILTALSVIAAGVLVRLARGSPFTNADGFELEEARQISRAIKQSIRALRTLIIVVFLTMFALVFAQPVLIVVMRSLPSVDTAIAGPMVSALIALLLSYVFIRVFTVIQGDVGLVDMQAKYLVSAVERKQAKRFADDMEKSSSPAPQNPEGYGKVIQ